MVYLTGEFCGWEARANPMHRISENGVWESGPMQLDTYTSYKYVIETHDGRLIYKSDLYANHFETRPATASKLVRYRGIYVDRYYLAQKTRRSGLFE